MGTFNQCKNRPAQQSNLKINNKSFHCTCSMTDLGSKSWELEVVKKKIYLPYSN